MSNVNNETFIDLVRRMRAAQSRWVYSSDASSLRESKKLERDVDHWLEREDGPRAAPTLFDKKEEENVSSEQ